MRRKPTLLLAPSIKIIDDHLTWPIDPIDPWVDFSRRVQTKYLRRAGFSLPADEEAAG